VPVPGQDSIVEECLNDASICLNYREIIVLQGEVRYCLPFVGGIMFAIIIYIFFLLIFIACPLPAQIVLFIINALVPDPIPIFDELIMVIAMLKKLSAIANIAEFLSEHWWARVLLGVLFFGVIAYLAKLFFYG